MFNDRLNESLVNSGYRRMASNAEGIYLFYLAKESEVTVISIIHAMSGYEITGEQYEHILMQMKNNIKSIYDRPIKLLSLILTAAPSRIKPLATLENEDSHWVIDISNNRLMVYENQLKDFKYLQQMLEELLAEEELEKQSGDLHQGMNNQGYDSASSYAGERPPRARTYRRSRSRFALTPITATIIAVNLIAYLVSHYTGFLGGEYAMLEKGALSWFYIKEDQEFYRLLTSMFMHADWDHLINNMIVLLFIGGNLESIAGRYRYLMMYFGSGIIAGLTSVGYNMWREVGNVSFFDTTISIGASGAIFGIVGAFLYIVIVHRGRIAEVSATQMVLFVVLSLYSGIVNSQIDQAAHVGGFISGFLLAVILYRKPVRRKST